MDRVICESKRMYKEGKVVVESKSPLAPLLSLSFCLSHSQQGTDQTMIQKLSASVEFMLDYMGLAP